MLKRIFSRINAISNIFSRSFSIEISENVQNAIHEAKPIVALESTIITHGMPRPDNYETAMEVEDIIRQNGALPATIGIIDGKVKVGLSSDEIHFLANITDPESCLKVSRRDLPYVMCKKLCGGTTVAATMILSHQAGIPVFVTGGIGGVHRGAETTFDVSADLKELGKTPITVVCAGVKSILDIEKTLEYLETEGVSIATFGDTNDFPSFFTSKSGFFSPFHINSVKDAAKMIHSRDNLKLLNGILFAVPIPGDSKDEICIEEAIIAALEEAKLKGISGKDVTPFILNRVNNLSKGVSLALNKKLIKNNALIGAQISVKLQEMRSYENSSYNSCKIPSRKPSSSGRKDVIVVGGTNVDYLLTAEEKITLVGNSLKGNIKKYYGGVGRNVAECISKFTMKDRLLFISAVGNDKDGESIKEDEKLLNTEGIFTIENSSTASYYATIDHNGDYLFGIANMDIHQQISANMLNKFESDLKEARLMIIDGNISAEVIDLLIKKCDQLQVPVWFEPTDPRKAAKPFQTNAWKKLTFISPNYRELQTMFSFISNDVYEIPTAENAILMCEQLVKYIPFILVTLGNEGVLLCFKESYKEGINSENTSDIHDEIITKHYPALKIPENEIVSVSGAGDCLAGTFIYGLLNGETVEVSIKAGIKAASLSLKSPQPVPSNIDLTIFEKQ